MLTAVYYIVSKQEAYTHLAVNYGDTITARTTVSINTGRYTGKCKRPYPATALFILVVALFTCSIKTANYIIKLPIRCANYDQFLMKRPKSDQQVGLLSPTCLKSCDQKNQRSQEDICLLNSGCTQLDVGPV